MLASALVAGREQESERQAHLGGGPDPGGGDWGLSSGCRRDPGVVEVLRRVVLEVTDDSADHRAFGDLASAACGQ